MPETATRLEHMFETGEVSALLEDMAPGPALAAALAGIDRSRLDGYDLVILVQARARQIAHDQAEFYADVAELARCPQGEIVRTEHFDEFCSEELQASLTLTRRAADTQLMIAYGLTTLPRVWEALRAGQIDLAKARTIVSHTDHLAPDAAQKIATAVLDAAPGLTTGQLSARLRRLCIENQPESAKNEYEQALTERRVVTEPNRDGTANLVALNLPPERVAAITNRINALARSLRARHEPRSVDQLRADILTDLLAGDRPLQPTRRGSVDIHVDLTTLLELDQRAGELPGWGPVIADIARQIAHDHGNQWRITLTHPDTNRVLWDGTTRRRPGAAMTRSVHARYHTCIFPGCRMPARDCDLDHRHPHTQGGPTCPHNLAPLCRRHHTAKHNRKWRIQRNPTGHHTLTSPHGHTYTTNARAP